MAERRTRSEARAETRRNLLDAATRLFFERGFGTTSLDDIAAEAGLTKGAVYSNFASKEDLLIEMLREARPALIDLSMLGGEGTLGHQIRAFGRSIAELRDTLGVALQAEYVSVALRNARAHEVYGDLIRSPLVELGAAFDQAVDTGDGDPTSPPRFRGIDVVVVVDALLQGLLIRRAVTPDLVPDQLIEDALSMLMSAFITGIVDADEALALQAERRSNTDVSGETSGRSRPADRRSPRPSRSTPSGDGRR